MLSPILTAASPSAASSMLHVQALAMFQTDMINSGNAKWLEIAVVIIAFSFLVIAVIMVGLAIAGYKAQKEIMGHVEEIKGKLLPLIDKSHGLVVELTPQIKEITGKVNLITGKVHDISGHVEEIVIVAKQKVNEVSPTITQANETVQDALSKAKITFADANQTVNGVNQKTRQQIDRVNGMVTGALDATTRLGKAIEHGITQPGRELAGLVAGARATVDNLLQQSSGLSSNLVGKLSGLFTKKRPTGPTYTAPSRPAPAYRTNPAPANVKPFGSMAREEAGVTSGSTGNGDPIL